MKHPDREMFQPGTRTLLVSIPIVLFLVTLLMPNLGHYWIETHLGRDNPEMAIRQIREGRRPGDAERMLPFVRSSDKSIRDRALREATRLEDPRALAMIFRFHREGAIDQEDLIEALSRYENPIYLPLIERESRNLPPETLSAMEESIERMIHLREWWEPPVYLEKRMEHHIEVLVGDAEPVVRWEDL